MEKTDIHDSFLLNQFHTFYESVIYHKERIRMRVRSKIDEAVGEHVLAEKATADPVYHKLQTLLEGQVVEARSRGGEYGVAYYREAQYVMASLADEIFIHMDWEGRHAWKSHLLEFIFFGTHDAGERIFEKIDRLLKANDPADAEMAAVYLEALALGFRGKYRDTDDRGMIAFYHRQLFKIIFQRTPNLLDEKRRLFHEPYAHTLDQGKKQNLPYLRWWGAIFAGLILVLVVTSHVLWGYLTEDIRQVAETIIREFNQHP